MKLGREGRRGRWRRIRKKRKNVRRQFTRVAQQPIEWNINGYGLTIQQNGSISPNYKRYTLRNPSSKK